MKRKKPSLFLLFVSLIVAVALFTQCGAPSDNGDDDDNNDDVTADSLPDGWDGTSDWQGSSLKVGDE